MGKNRRRRGIKSFTQKFNTHLRERTTEQQRKIRCNILVERKEENHDRIDKKSQHSTKSVFISNLPYDVSAKELVDYLNTKVIEMMKGRNLDCPILGGKIIVDYVYPSPKSKGCANIKVLNSDVENLLISMSQMWSLKGRALRIKSNENTRFDLKKESFIGEFEGISFDAGNCISDDGVLLIQWCSPTFPTRPNCFRFIEFKSRTFEVISTFKDTYFKVSMTFRKIGRIQIERDVNSGNIYITFDLRQPPFIEKAEDNCLFDKFSYIVGEKKEQWERSIDPTGAMNIFSRCKTFRIGFKKTDCENVLSLLRKFSVYLYSHEVNPALTPTLKIDDLRFIENVISKWNVFANELWTKLPENLVYLLSALFTTGKVDPISVILAQHLSSYPCEVSISELDRFFTFVLNLSQFDKFQAEALVEYFVSDLSLTYIPDPLDAFMKLLDNIGNDGLDDLVDFYQNTYDRDLEGIVYTRRVFITPTRIVVRLPELDLSNRILYDFKPWQHRFVRVSFVDENFGPTSSYSASIYQLRVTPLMQYGFNIFGRTYKFLAYSNSQLREHSCWFYNEDPAMRLLEDPADRPIPSIDQIHKSIGDLHEINIVGKYGSRLGQGFSSYILSFPLKASWIGETAEIERNGHCFSDGVGTLTKRLARELSKELRLKHIPSAFQVRLGGCKGMLSVAPESSSTTSALKRVLVRPSMRKFRSEYTGLNIVGYAVAYPMYLNRQIIPILRYLGATDESFMALLTDMLSILQTALDESSAAVILLTRFCGELSADHSTAMHSMKQDGNDERTEELEMSVFSSLQSVRVAAYALEAGFQHRNDRLLQSIVYAVISKLTLDIIRKARIFVEKAVCLIGIIDETGLLKNNEVFVKYTDRRTGSIQVLERDVAVGRNPSLHPGDIRVLQAVNIPQLQYLTDVIVFSQQGERPKFVDMSGGDLDGDIYFVIFDDSLMPSKEKLCKPMNYDAPSSATASNEAGVFDILSLPSTLNMLLSELHFVKEDKVSTSHEGIEFTSSDIATFFVDYMRNDNLGQIAVAHMIWADLNGIFSHECQQLALLHSIAVDFPKKGVPADFPSSLRYKQCPDFMEKFNKPVYDSPHILGKLYRHVKRFRSTLDRLELAEIKLDEDIVNVPGYEVYMEEAENHLQLYNYQLWRIMQSYEVFSEGELLSGQVAKFLTRMSGEKGHEVQMRLNREVKMLKDDFTKCFWEEFVVNEYDDHDDDNDQNDWHKEYLEQEEILEDAADEVDDARGRIFKSVDHSTRFPLAMTTEQVQQALAKASAWYRACYQEALNMQAEAAENRETNGEPILLLSFAWIPWQCLSMLKKRK